MKVSELRGQSWSDLQVLLLKLRREQAALRMQNAALEQDQKVDIHRMNLIRKEIARIKTIMNEEKV